MSNLLSFIEGSRAGNTRGEFAATKGRNDSLVLEADEAMIALVGAVGSFVFTTEAHLLPLTLARLSNRTAMPVGLRQNFFPFNQCQINLNFQLKEGQRDDPVDEDVEYANSCPSTIFLFPNDKVSEY